MGKCNYNCKITCNFCFLSFFLSAFASVFVSFVSFAFFASLLFLASRPCRGLAGWLAGVIYGLAYLRHVLLGVRALSVLALPVLAFPCRAVFLAACSPESVPCFPLCQPRQPCHRLPLLAAAPGLRPLPRETAKPHADQRQPRILIV